MLLYIISLPSKKNETSELGNACALLTTGADDKIVVWPGVLVAVSVKLVEPLDEPLAWTNNIVVLSACGVAFDMLTVEINSLLSLTQLVKLEIAELF